MNVGEVLTYSYTGGVKELLLDAGEYLLECWGAEGNGGTSNTSDTYVSSGGKGGYAKGNIVLDTDAILKIFVGGKNTSSACINGAAYGGWNGGGCGSSSLNRTGGGGGGASDIRIGGTALANRVIVAGGGGGGGGRYGDGLRDGGNGGGVSGSNAEGSGGSGGSQTAGGNSSGTLGVGGLASINTTDYGRGGGGGGYYGGGYSPTNYYGGGGGSSFLGTLLNASTSAGVRSGHGEIKITMISGGTIKNKRRFAQII